MNQFELADFNDKALKITIELTEGGQMPTKAHPMDAGFDCYVREFEDIGDYSLKCYLGFKIEVPINHVGLIFPRSSIKDYDLILSNSVGVIDCNFKNEVTVIFKKIEGERRLNYIEKERCCQIIILPLPQISLVEGTISEDNTRGGYGSTRK